jgi:hypothetical protein
MLRRNPIGGDREDCGADDSIDVREPIMVCRGEADYSSGLGADLSARKFFLEISLSFTGKS